MDPQTKKFLLIIVGMGIAFAIFQGAITGGQYLLKERDTLLDQPLGVEITDTQARINFNGKILTFPAPEKYCFLDKENLVDQITLTTMNNIQKTYKNHLWAAFANCDQLKAVRETNNMSTYIDTGMIVTPITLLETEVTAENYLHLAKNNIQHLDPVRMETAINQTMQDNLPSLNATASGRPVIYKDDDKALMFMITHDMTEGQENTAFKLTEFDVLTTLENRAVSFVFTYKDLKDPAFRQDFTKTYITSLLQ